MSVVPLREQINENAKLTQNEASSIIATIEDGKEVVFFVKRGEESNHPCLRLKREGDDILATGSYYVGVDWIKENELAVQVSPKMNDGNTEIDYVKMLNDALSEKENFNHLKDLVTIRFDKPSIIVNQQQDLLSIFLIAEYLNLLHRIVGKGLKKSYRTVESNLSNRVKGRILIGKNIRRNLMKGNITDNVCSYQVYDIDSPENRILKKALRFSIKQLNLYEHAHDMKFLNEKARYVLPYFNNVGDEIKVTSIQTCKVNPIYREYKQAVESAQLLLRRYSYDITRIGKQKISTPPFWIDMSKLFELYVFYHLRKVFTEKNEIRYHLKAHHQELDYLLNSKGWNEPYVIDAKYKPKYKEGTIIKDDARQVSGYARLSKIYEELKLNPDKDLPIKCLIIYPDQDEKENFTFTKDEEPEFNKITDYVRFYKCGIKLPVTKVAT